MLRALQGIFYRVSYRHSILKNFPVKASHNIGERLTMAATLPLLYHSLESVLNTFNKPEHKNENGVSELLEIYNTAYEQKKKYDALGEVKKFPLIVLEGLDGSGKTTVGKRLAKKLDAEKWRTPPNSIAHLRDLFDNNTALRTAYYSLGNYIAALEVQLMLKDRPVVMDRFWHSTSAFALAQAVQDDPGKYAMPLKGDKVYCWPEDLFKPDFVLLLNVSEEVRLQRQSRRKAVTTQESLLNSNSQFRQNIIYAYGNMYNPGVEFINGDYSFRSVLNQIGRIINHLFW